MAIRAETAPDGREPRFRADRRDGGGVVRTGAGVNAWSLLPRYGAIASPGRYWGMRNRALAALAGLAILGGCGRAPQPDDGIRAGQTAPPPRTNPSLDASLARMEAELDTALAAGVDGAGIERLYRAEEISNRLLESHLPFAWLETENYSVDARLRQIQSVADRVVARIRSAGPRADLIADIEALRGEIRVLRAGLARGGTAAPVPIERLLTQLDSARR